MRAVLVEKGSGRGHDQDEEDSLVSKLLLPGQTGDCGVGGLSLGLLLVELKEGIPIEWELSDTSLLPGACLRKGHRAKAIIVEE